MAMVFSIENGVPVRKRSRARQPSSKICKTYSRGHRVLLPAVGPTTYFDSVSGYIQVPQTGRPNKYNRMTFAIQQMQLVNPGKFSDYACENARPFVSNRSSGVYYPCHLACTSAQVYDELERSRTRAFEGLVNSLGTNAELGAFLAEGREALTMVASRAKQLWDAYRALRKGDFKSFCRSLKIRPKSKHKRTRRTSARDSAALWLEYWFGWVPMLSDISSAITVLGGTIPSTHLRARGHKTLHFDRQPFHWNGSWFTGDVHVATSFTTWVRVDNPNLALFARLGLTSPLAVAWEVVPFSFLVDWFVPVDTFLRGMSPFHGLTLYDYTASSLVGGFGQGFSPVGTDRYSGWYSDSSYLSYGRTLDKPTMGKLRPAVMDKLSITRALTSISLLISLFLKDV